HVQRARARLVHGDAVNAVTDLGGGIGNVLRVQAAIDRLPGFAAVVGAKASRRGDGDVDALRVGRIEQDGVQPEAARAGRPLGAGAVPAQAGKLLPILPAIGRAEQRRVFHAGIDGVPVAQRRLEMPDALELPRVRRAVVPLMRRQRLAGFRRGVIDELVAFGLGHSLPRGGRLARFDAGLLPGFPAVAGALDDLPEPSAGLRRVDPVRIDGRALEVVDLPAAKVRPAHIPALALAVGGEDERAFACADQYSYRAHGLLLPGIESNMLD